MPLRGSRRLVTLLNPKKGGGANVLRSRIDNTPLRSRVTGQYLVSRSA